MMMASLMKATTTTMNYNRMSTIMNHEFKIILFCLILADTDKRR